MTADMIPFDYAAHGIAADAAVRLEAYALSVEASHQNALAAMMRAAKALANARDEFPGDREFGRWRTARLPWLSSNMASQYLNVWNQYGHDPRFALDTCQGDMLGIAPSLMRMLAQPAADDVREEVEDRIRAGEHVTVAEFERMKREAAAAKAETNTVRRDLEQLQQKSAEKAAKASRREANLIEDKNRALADKAAAEARTAEEVKRAQEAAWAEADEKYETLVRRLNREAAEARRLAEEKTKALDAAVAQARAEAGQAAKDLGEALAAKALETRKSELDKLDAAAAKAEARVATAARTEAVLQGEIRKHEAYLAKCRGEEAEALEQIKLARDLSEFLGQKMAELTLFEYDVQPVARPKILRAAQMCGQMAQALDAFLAPRLVTQGGAP